MQILIIRKYKGQSYTIGDLYIDGKLICNTLEDADRGLSDAMSVEEIAKKKIKCLTAIPVGCYKVTLNVKSPSFSKKAYYKKFCDGYLPRLINVKGFDGILIHRGVDDSNSCGCILVGYNTIKGKLTDSQKAFEKVYELLKSAKDEITIEIK